MSQSVAPAPHDIFTDDQRWGDLDEWNDLEHVIPRLESIEPAGDPTLTKTTFVGGHKTLPIRYDPSATN